METFVNPQRAGAAMWLLQPFYILTEFITATAVTVPYSFIDNTISELGASTCSAVGDPPYGPVPVCSPWHDFMNVSFIVSGILLATGAILLWRWIPSGGARGTAVVLWVISGLSSIGTGLVPLDQNLILHGVVAFPAFVAQPAALIVMGLGLRRQRPGLGWSGFAAGVVSAVASIAFIVRTGDTGSGLFERLALWPSYLWIAVLAVIVFSSGSRGTVRPA